MKRVVLLAAILLVTLVIVSPIKHVQADACTDQCQATYNDCISNSDRNYDACYDQAEINEWGCEDDAYSTYEQCMDQWGWWAAMGQQMCQNPYDNARLNCWNSFNNQTASCASQRSTSESTCQGQLDNCLSHCP